MRENERMTEAEFAKAVGEPEWKVARLRRNRFIQARKCGRKVYYLPEDIQAFHEAFRLAALPIGRAA